MKNLAQKVCRFVNNSYICSAKNLYSKSTTLCPTTGRTLSTYELSIFGCKFLAENKGYALSFCTNINL